MSLSKATPDLIARIALSGIFINATVGHISNFSGKITGMESKGIPIPKVLLIVAIGFLILGSASVLLGIKARIGAILLILFLVPVTYYFHAFWQDNSELQAFLMNSALIGGLLLLICHGSGKLSIDRYITKKGD